MLRDALSSVVDKVDFAFVYGSMARGDEQARSDIDVMIVGAISLGEAVQALLGAQDQLRREVNPTVFSRQEYVDRLKVTDSFVAQVSRKPVLWIIGDDLRSLSEP